MLNYKYNTELQHVDNTASNTSQVDIELEDIDLSTDIKTMLNAENPISNSTTCELSADLLFWKQIGIEFICIY